MGPRIEAVGGVGSGLRDVAGPVITTAEDLQPGLAELGRLCESCLGPAGCLKMVVTSAGSLVTTSSAPRLLPLLPLDNPLAEFLLAAARPLPDHRLFCIAMAARLLAAPPTSTGRPVLRAAELQDWLEAAAVQVDLGSLEQMLSLAVTALASKASGAGLLPGQVEKLGRALVQAWLTSLPTGQDTLGEVVVRVGEGGGPDQITISPGLLFLLGPDQEQKAGDAAKLSGPVRLALCDVSLEPQVGEAWEGITLEYDLESEAEWEERGAGQAGRGAALAAAGVQLLACQKVVGWQARRDLAQAGVAVLDRLGTAAFLRLQRLSGGRALPEPKAGREGDWGRLDWVEHIQVGDRTFLQLNNTDSGLVTLSLASLGSEQAAELELVVARALDCMTELATQPAPPRALPGGGCLEALLAARLTGDPALRSALVRLSLAPGGLQLARAGLDTATGHLYREEGAARCECGLMSGPPPSWLPALSLLHSQAALPLVAAPPPAGPALLLDSLPAKRAALLTALEAAEGLSEIGAVLYC